jgi:NAD(P)H-nitrite reductase large subunit
MGVKNENIPNKGAAVEKGLETYTIILISMVVFLDLPTLHKIADVAEKYQVECILK